MSIFPCLAEAVNPELKSKIEVTTELALQGKIDWVTGLKKRINLLKNIVDKDLALKVASKLTYVKGAKKTLKKLKKRGYHLVVITGGFDIVAKKLEKEFKIEVICNELVFDGNKLVDVKIKVADKSLVFKERFHSAPYAVIGDGANDLNLMKEAKLKIGYNPKHIVKQYLEKNNGKIIYNLEDLLKILK